MEALELARAQFGLNIAFHILFPTLSIGLAWYLVGIKTYQSLHYSEHLEILSAWIIKVFALTFALGAASGIVMSFQFGTNWPGFMEKVGSVAGPLLSYEILSAFFLEATFLGVLLFGKKYVPTWLHTLSAWAVAFGTTLSAFWILALNSWMHTPAGVAIVESQLVVTDWFAVVFNPSFPYRFGHMFMACLVTATFFLLGMFAYKALKSKANQMEKDLWVGYLKKLAPLALVLAILQAVLGDFHGLNTLEHQPAKVAAMEGVWEDKKGAPLLLFAIPDSEKQMNHFEIGIPKVASLILTHDLDGEIKGLKSFEDRPDKVGIIFYSFRVMVGLGVLMILVSLWVVLSKTTQIKNIQLVALSSLTFAGWIAVLAGWMVTEIGRQPWLVTGILRTSEAAGSVSATTIAASLTTYAVLYLAVLVVYISTVYVLANKLKLHKD